MKKAEAKALGDSLLRYVASGNGLVVIHGGIVMQNKSLPFNEMVGGRTLSVREGR
jgi:hypothetical protein